MVRSLAALALALSACVPPPAARSPSPDAPALAPAAVRYLSLGDSFTIGTGSSPDAAFPARLAARWSAPRCAVTLRNPAVNGFTTQDVIDREIPEAGPFAPTLVTLAIGANDLVRGATLDRYRAQLDRIFEGLAAAGVPATRVVALPQPDWARSPAATSFGDPAEIHRTIVAFNAALREVTEARGGRYLDLFPLMQQQAAEGRVARDGLHPDASAHDAWAAAIAAQLGDPCAAP
jgi:acyl-CoA thioesterase-1